MCSLNFQRSLEQKVHDINFQNILKDNDLNFHIPTTTHSNPTRDEIKKQVERCAPNIEASLENIDKSSDGINLVVKNFSNAIMDTFKEH